MHSHEHDAKVVFYDKNKECYANFLYIFYKNSHSRNVVNLNGVTGKQKKSGSSALVACGESVDYRHRAVGSAGGVIAVELTPVVARCHVAARVEVILAVADGT